MVRVIDNETAEFVSTTLTPTLTPALVALCKAKPADPVVWLAEWLLANKPPPPAFSVTDAFKAAALEVFALADADGSKQLDFEEIREIASHDGEAQAILMHLDSDQNGVVSEEEWLSFFMGLFDKARPVAEMLLQKSAYMIFTREFMSMCMALFYEFDADRSGKLELNEILVAIGDDEKGAKFIEYADRNGDKELTLDEWMQFLFGFWQANPRYARGMVGFLMEQAETMRMMPAMPPPRPPE